MAVKNLKNLYILRLFNTHFRDHYYSKQLQAQKYESLFGVSCNITVYAWNLPYTANANCSQFSFYVLFFLKMLSYRDNKLYNLEMQQKMFLDWTWTVLKALFSISTVRVLSFSNGLYKYVTHINLYIN